jgi:hypothetical protein
MLVGKLGCVWRGRAGPYCIESLCPCPGVESVVGRTPPAISPIVERPGPVFVEENEDKGVAVPPMWNKVTQSPTMPAS